MSEISDLERRISAAMDRISRGLEALPVAAVVETSDPGVAEALDAARADLENEKLANTQLEDRVKTLNAKLEETEAALADAKDAVEQAAEAREAAADQLREAQAAHEAKLTGLRDAQAAHEAELTELREAKAAEPAQQVIDLDAHRDPITQLAKRLGRMRRTSSQLRGSNQQLRDAVKKNLSDPALINQSLQGELESLKAMRAAELAEMDLIMSALRPMLGDVTAAPAQDKTDEGEDA